MWITRSRFDRIESRISELECQVKDLSQVYVKLETPREGHDPYGCGSYTVAHTKVPLLDVVHRLAEKVKLVALSAEAAKPARVK